MTAPFENTTVGGIDVRNRIFRSATYEAAAVRGQNSDAIVAMYKDLAEGGIGLIITGMICFSKTDHPGGSTISLLDAAAVEDLRKSTSTVHDHGAKIVAQLNHGGSQLFSPPKGPVYGPSEVADPISQITPKAFTEDQIRELISEFGDAAARAQKAGFDGVQIHAAHGYLLSKFLSPVFNQRTDAYGGTPLQRARIILEILADTKTKCGSKYPVWIKLNCSDFHPTDSGLTFDDVRIIARELAQQGIDAIEVSGGTLSGKYLPSRSKKHAAYHLEYAKQLAEEVGVPVILVGGIRSIATIEQIFSQTPIAAISMSRPLVREPQIVNRWMAGDRRDAECIACNGCFNPNGTRCFFTLNEQEKAVQKEIMKMMTPKRRET